MKVLVACEYSGIVRDAFKDKGHEAWSCDVLPPENGGNHIQDDVLNHLDDGWDLLIAHPPCTYLSRAGARWLYPKAGQIDKDRYNLGIKGKEFFIKFLEKTEIIQDFLWNYYLNKIDKHNPFEISKFE